MLLLKKLQYKEEKTAQKRKKLSIKRRYPVPLQVKDPGQLKGSINL
ncbi:hypothetical protein SAMD00020551_2842 [Mesobacillus selenatarsenatis SF-1]|uniref:Uncharacterized protein n=1 Tax=Mesobacillus selenatarsenatis (strain DSM 18680 / JCM 14380 / FERM P-15431 / SF-1) TaxID=1321606 RepID=A0A0A8X5Y1_MESS1|nr:hypothetical protein SAMD00020551_2842 [Mesobacillus selenatarsenatis SF-1]